MPAPSRNALTELCTYVKEMECDLGIATDGDADRLGVIDDQGRYLTANDILRLLYYYLLKYKGWRGPAVRNVATTHMLDRMAESFGEVCYEVPVGFKHISAKMQETGAIIGGESSGGLTVRGHINGKDGIYAASLLVEMIAVTGKKLSELAAEIEQQYGTTYMEERSRRFDAERKGELMRILYEDRLLPQFDLPIEKVSYLDGCKVYFQNGGWISARFSGTEPLLRIFCEMENQELAENYCDLFEHFLNL
jgi:phosphomannomutase